MSYGPDNSVRGACSLNLVGKTSLQMLEGITPAHVWFADSTVSVSGTGKNWSSAFSTIAEAVAAAGTYDTIFLRGSFNESVACTTIGVKFVGVGSSQRETYWTAPTVAGSYCLTMGAAYQSIENIYMKPVAYTTSGIPSGIKLSGASWATIKNMRFQGQTGSYKAIYSPVCDSDNVRIIGNEFKYLNTATHGCGIFGVEAGGLSYSGWLVEDNDFSSCTTDLDFNGRACVLRGNSHPVGGVTAAGVVNAAVTGVCIDLSGTSSGGNVVTGCSLAGDYTSTLYIGGAAGDCWAGNYAAITSTYCPNGVTVPAKPA